MNADGGLQTHLKAVIQFMLARRFLPHAELVAWYAKLLATLGLPETQETALGPVLVQINSAIDNCGLRIESVIADESSDKYTGLINTNADQVARFATGYREKQLVYFRTIIEKCVQSSSISGIDALNVAEEIPGGFTKKEAGETLTQLVDDHWLHRSDDGEISFGVRSSLELGAYIEERFEEVPMCTVCQSAALRSVHCPTRQCSGRTHLRCARAWFSTKDESLCPMGCNATWTMTTLGGKLSREIDAARRERQRAQANNVHVVE
eukprot:TRINITY_DN2079_c0_g1_i2.p1 TRINITY_DN2079_c0_g1~~TRINITY_DN2079_c0_g1_i2.p1  ORF type:complete len:265 (-),score=85.69 TRINITY_DN2079_c0_g1_i2:33-827(-)